MHQENHTGISEFFLLGFQNLSSFKIPFFILIFSLYVITTTSNLFIVLLVSLSRTLHTPMYFFLGHLSLCDILLSMNVIPNMLDVILKEGTTISLLGCLTQLFMFALCCIAECYILSMMSCDRYLAICNPLRYSSIMDFKMCLFLVVLSWSLGFLISIITCLLIYELEFCNRNIIDHFFCEFFPIVNLSCSDTSVVELEVSIATPFILLFPFVFLIVTYVYIFLTILGISSTMGRQKAFSTCSSHLTVVCLYYGTLISIYLSPSNGYSLNINKVTSLFYTLVTPLFNPVIYSLRNKDIRKEFNAFVREQEHGCFTIISTKIAKSKNKVH
ncbi:olfactory receptor 5P66-like [Pelobates fuscus]|uniref:olfactory receptor 5P66-like n=1 Tax=Pelobates fuscus TaxID=191477 RepID=UPI002FE4D489